MNTTHDNQNASGATSPVLILPGIAIPTSTPKYTPIPASDRLDELKRAWDAMEYNYGPDRTAAISAYHAEKGDRRYFDARLEAWARVNGAPFGEKTMLQYLDEAGGDIECLSSVIDRAECMALLA